MLCGPGFRTREYAPKRQRTTQPRRLGQRRAPSARNGSLLRDAGADTHQLHMPTPSSCAPPGGRYRPPPPGRLPTPGPVPYSRQAATRQLARREELPPRGDRGGRHSLGLRRSPRRNPRQLPRTPRMPGVAHPDASGRAVSGAESFRSAVRLRVHPACLRTSRRSLREHPWSPVPQSLLRQAPGSLRGSRRSSTGVRRVSRARARSSSGRFQRKRQSAKTLSASAATTSQRSSSSLGASRPSEAGTRRKY